MEKFMFIFRNAPMPAGFQPTPEAMQEMLAQWQAWIGALAAQNKLIVTEGLQQSGKVISTSAHTLSDGPYADAKEVVGGFMLLYAQDLAEAMELAKDAPTLKSNGSVEVRPVQNYG